MNRFRGGLVCKAHRLVYHSTLGSRVIKKKKMELGWSDDTSGPTKAARVEVLLPYA